jgi:hypothetical protein
MSGEVRNVDPETGEVMPPNPPGTMTSIIQVLQAHEGGQLVRDASIEHQKLIAEINARGLLHQKSKGSVTIVLNYEGDGDVLMAHAEIKTKMPKELGRRRTAFYIANRQFLSQRDPGQHDLPFREVPSSSDELRTAG